MKISVVIPAYNSSATIEATLGSVLRQTVQADEILVLDDGSTDNTVEVLNSYKPRVTVLQQKNRGVAHARNALCQRAKGDIIAFLDHDDIWHPSYLETQCKIIGKHPSAVAYFTGHVNFQGTNDYIWDEPTAFGHLDYRCIEPDEFIKLYNKCPGPFGSMSFCCIPKRLLNEVGSEPFPVQVSGADDYYIFNVLPRWGPVVFTPATLVAYRESTGAQSADRLKGLGLAVRVFELLAGSRKGQPGREYAKIFTMAFASKRRQYAKFLMGAGKISEARMQLKYSLINAGGALSLVKSMGLLLATYMPAPFQPRWPARLRE